MNTKMAAVLAASLSASQLPAAPADFWQAKAAAEQQAALAGPKTSAKAYASTNPLGVSTAIVDLGADSPGYINKQQLPADFKIGEHSHGIVFNKEQTKFAYIGLDGKLKVDAVPANKIVQVGDLKMDLNTGVPKDPKEVSQSFDLPPGAAAAMMNHSSKSAPSKSLGRHSKYTDTDTKLFEGVTRVDIQGNGAVTIGNIGGSALEAAGAGKETAELKNGVLTFKNFTGVINLPAGVKAINIDLKMGSVSGTIPCGGSIKTESGEIRISVPKEAHLAIDCSESKGRVLVPGAKDVGNGRYEPASEKAADTLKVATGFGTVQVRTTR